MFTDLDCLEAALGESHVLLHVVGRIVAAENEAGAQQSGQHTLIAAMRKVP
jgi:hypothetical protein